MAQTNNADIIAFMARYPNALDVYLTTDGRSYQNHQYEEALDYVKRKEQILYKVDAALEQVQVYPAIPLIYYELSDYQNDDLKTAVIDGEEVAIPLSPSAADIETAYSSAANLANLVLSNFIATYSSDTEDWRIVFSLTDDVVVSVYDTNDAETLFQQIEAPDEDSGSGDVLG